MVSKRAGVLLPTAQLTDKWYKDNNIDRAEVAIETLDVTDKSFGSVERVLLFEKWSKKYGVDHEVCLSMYCQAIRDGINASQQMLEE